MNPINFEGANMNFTKPSDMTDEQCSSLPAWKGEDKDGVPIIVSYWQPNQKDIELIKNGHSLCLIVCGENMPPVSLCTFDENNNAII